MLRTTTILLLLLVIPACYGEYVSNDNVPTGTVIVGDQEKFDNVTIGIFEMSYPEVEFAWANSVEQQLPFCGEFQTDCVFTPVATVELEFENGSARYKFEIPSCVEEKSSAEYTIIAWTDLDLNGKLDLNSVLFAGGSSPGGTENPRLPTWKESHWVINVRCDMHSQGVGWATDPEDDKLLDSPDDMRNWTITF